MTAQTITTTTEDRKPEEVFFEITLLDGSVYQKGAEAPIGTITDSGKNVPVYVEDYDADGDWVDVQLSGGWAIGFPAPQVARFITRSL
ncbi:hypothetical protein ACFYPN_16035 [Streptomyces sp. NPDC005576]|uniref:hypothetical protein n=1 Tax=Streptomyces sp. NPDC005576 TaxID=3364726 RepID=UPI0036830E99